jgi:hypothetical protein
MPMLPDSNDSQAETGRAPEERRDICGRLEAPGENEDDRADDHRDLSSRVALSSREPFKKGSAASQRERWNLPRSSQACHKPKSVVFLRNGRIRNRAVRRRKEKGAPRTDSCNLSRESSCVDMWLQKFFV